jgi:hypothetical protein
VLRLVEARHGLGRRFGLGFLTGGGGGGRRRDLTWAGTYVPQHRAGEPCASWGVHACETRVTNCSDGDRQGPRLLHGRVCRHTNMWALCHCFWCVVSAAGTAGGFALGSALTAMPDGARCLYESFLSPTSRRGQEDREKGEEAREILGRRTLVRRGWWCDVSL